MKLQKLRENRFTILQYFFLKSEWKGKFSVVGSGDDEKWLSLGE